MYKVDRNQRVSITYTLQCICDWCQTSAVIPINSSTSLNFDLMNLTNVDCETTVPPFWSYSELIDKLQCPECSKKHPTLTIARRINNDSHHKLVREDRT